MSKVKNLEIGKNGVENPPKGAILNVQLEGVSQALNKLSTVNPISYEISRAVKKVNTELEGFLESRDDLMNEYYLRDGDGNYVPTEDVEAELKSLEAKSTQKVDRNRLSIFAYQYQSPEKEGEFKKKFDLLCREYTEFSFASVNATTKMVKTDEGRVPLLSVLSEHFTSSDILLLEELGILVGLD